MDDHDIKNTKELPLVALRDLVVFPNSLLSFDVGRVQSVEALQEALENDSLIFLTAQKDSGNDEPDTDDLYLFGTVAKIRQVFKLPGNNVRVISEGLERGVIMEFVQDKPYFRVCVNNAGTDDAYEESLAVTAMVRTAHSQYEIYASLSGKYLGETSQEIQACHEPGKLADLIAVNSNIKIEDKQRILEEKNCVKRLSDIVALLLQEIEIQKVQNDVYAKVSASIEKNQKDYFLREQMKVIRQELGEAEENAENDILAYRKKLGSKEYPLYVREKAEKEIKRLERTGNFHAESSVIRDYLDWILDIEWVNKTNEDVSLKRAREILDRDHYGLEKVKDRIIEYLAVRRNNAENGVSNALDAPILCLVGPPGVGKTSIAKSVAACLNRKYIRISLGGVRDEAEIRGHRKTYVGAMPGRIINAMKQASVANPLILLDEVDKMSSDFRGNPADALLEVLDGEQNVSFRDHYLELPYDLSDVLFICTANTIDPIPQALKDRMEVINISSYILDEKINIAKKYLIKKQLLKHSLKKSQLKIKDNVVKDIILYYTKEAGVRQLERHIGDICRKAVKQLVSDDGVKSVSVTNKNLEEYLNSRKYRKDDRVESPQIGVAKGLAWTSMGGETLSIEVNNMEGTGKFELTGNMGEVMKESARAAISYIRSVSREHNINKSFYKNTDIHIHIPEGAVPKDGPSAGVTMAVAMLSSLTGKPVSNDVGMTGEITIRGRVLPIGGLKEKVVAAKSAGLTKIIIPFDNASDLNELPGSIKDGLEFVLAKDMEDVLSNALVH